MKQLLYQSSLGIQFNKEVSKGQCTVKVQTKTGKRAYTLKRYTYPNVELSVSSPFLSWENLNCCNGWAYLTWNSGGPLRGDQGHAPGYLFGWERNGDE